MTNTLFIDIENIGEPWDGELLLVGWALNNNDVVVDTEVSEFVELMLANPNIVKVSQSTHDPRYLALAGYPIAGEWHDTKVMAWVLNENTPLDIDWMAWRYAGIDMDKRLKRSGGEVFFRDDDDQLYNLKQWREWPPTVFAHFVEYNRRDVETLRDLYWGLHERLEESEWLDYFLTEEVPYTSVLVNMETRGLPVNLDDTAAFAEELEATLVEQRERLLSEAGLPESFNLNSQKQMVAYLFGRVVRLADTLVYDRETIEAYNSCVEGEHEDCDLFFEGEWEVPLQDTTPLPAGHVVNFVPEGFTVEKVGRDRFHGYWTVKGRGLAETPHTVNKVTGEESKLPSVSSPELLYQHGKDPWVYELCMGYRKSEKLLTTYLRRFPEQAVGGRLYGRFNQTGTVTGRLSSSGPNLQNQPSRGELGKRTRGLFQPPEGVQFVIGDYDQLEMRLMAHFSQDPELVRVFNEGLDPHLITAQAIFGMGIDEHGDERGIGKTLNFAIGYGAGAKKVAQVLSLAGYPTSKATAKGYLAELQGFYREFYRWKDRTVELAKRKGSVKTIGGRRRRLRTAFKDTANWKAMGYGERQAVNAIIQGSAADIIRRVMVATEDNFHDVGLLAQVHDELIWETHPSFNPATLGELRKFAQEGHGFDLRVPLLFEPELCNNWSEKGDGVGFDDLFDEEEE